MSIYQTRVHYGINDERLILKLKRGISVELDGISITPKMDGDEVRKLEKGDVYFAERNTCVLAVCEKVDKENGWVVADDTPRGKTYPFDIGECVPIHDPFE